MFTRVLVAEDDDLDRAGLRLLLAQEPDLVLVGEARSGPEALELAARIAPDLLVMNLHSFPMEDPTRAFAQVSPRTRVVILEDNVNELQLRSAVRQALSDAHSIDRGPAPTRVRARRRPAAHANPLSPRERDVLALLARGHTNAQIGAELNITPHTVKVHVEHILAKLGVSHRTQAAVRAIQLGYIEFQH